MDIITVFGSTWHIPDWFEIGLLVVMISLVIFLLLIIKYNQIVKEKRLHEYQLLLFKMKRRGLSSFQIKIINNMIEILRLKEPRKLIYNAEYFEKALGRFLHYIRNSSDQEDSLADVCREITLLYENLYHHTSYKKPLNELKEIEIYKLIYFTVNDGSSFLGKIVSKEDDEFTVELFRSPKQLRHLAPGQNVRAYIWRFGDAEYIFDSSVKEVDEKIVRLAVPREFERGREFRHPYVEVLIEATLIIEKREIDEDETGMAAPVQCTVFRLNDYEAVARINQTLDYDSPYHLEFVLEDYNFEILVNVLSHRTVRHEHIYYYTLKFEEMSDAAGEVLKKYIYEHL